MPATGMEKRISDYLDAHPPIVKPQSPVKPKAIVVGKQKLSKIDSKSDDVESKCEAETTPKCDIEKETVKTDPVTVVEPASIYNIPLPCDLPPLPGYSPPEKSNNKRSSPLPKGPELPPLPPGSESYPIKVEPSAPKAAIPQSKPATDPQHSNLTVGWQNQGAWAAPYPRPLMGVMPSRVALQQGKMPLLPLPASGPVAPPRGFMPPYPMMSRQSRPLNVSGPPRVPVPSNQGYYNNPGNVRLPNLAVAPPRGQITGPFNLPLKQCFAKPPPLPPSQPPLPTGVPPPPSSSAAPSSVPPLPASVIPPPVDFSVPPPPLNVPTQGQTKPINQPQIQANPSMEKGKIIKSAMEPIIQAAMERLKNRKESVAPEQQKEEVQPKPEPQKGSQKPRVQTYRMQQNVMIGKRLGFKKSLKPLQKSNESNKISKKEGLYVSSAHTPIREITPVPYDAGTDVEVHFEDPKEPTITMKAITTTLPSSTVIPHTEAVVKESSPMVDGCALPPSGSSSLQGHLTPTERSEDITSRQVDSVMSKQPEDISPKQEKETVHKPLEETVPAAKPGEFFLANVKRLLNTYVKMKNIL